MNIKLGLERRVDILISFSLSPILISVNIFSIDEYVDNSKENINQVMDSSVPLHNRQRHNNNNLNLSNGIQSKDLIIQSNGSGTGNLGSSGNTGFDISDMMCIAERNGTSVSDRGQIASRISDNNDSNGNVLYSDLNSSPAPSSILHNGIAGQRQSTALNTTTASGKRKQSNASTAATSKGFFGNIAESIKGRRRSSSMRESRTSSNVDTAAFGGPSVNRGVLINQHFVEDRGNRYTVGDNHADIDTVLHNISPRVTPHQSSGSMGAELEKGSAAIGGDSGDLPYFKGNRPSSAHASANPGTSHGLAAAMICFQEPDEQVNASSVEAIVQPAPKNDIDSLVQIPDSIQNNQLRQNVINNTNNNNRKKRSASMTSIAMLAGATPSVSPRANINISTSSAASCRRVVIVPAASSVSRSIHSISENAETREKIKSGPEMISKKSFRLAVEDSTEEEINRRREDWEEKEYQVKEYVQQVEHAAQDIDEFLDQGMAQTGETAQSQLQAVAGDQNINPAWRVSLPGSITSGAISTSMQNNYSRLRSLSEPPNPDSNVEGARTRVGFTDLTATVSTGVAIVDAHLRPQEAFGSNGSSNASDDASRSCEVSEPSSRHKDIDGVLVIGTNPETPAQTKKMSFRGVVAGTSTGEILSSGTSPFSPTTSSMVVLSDSHTSSKSPSAHNSNEAVRLSSLTSILAHRHEFTATSPQADVFLVGGSDSNIDVVPSSSDINDILGIGGRMVRKSKWHGSAENANYNNDVVTFTDSSSGQTRNYVLRPPLSSSNSRILSQKHQSASSSTGGGAVGSIKKGRASEPHVLPAPPSINAQQQGPSSSFSTASGHGGGQQNHGIRRPHTATSNTPPVLSSVVVKKVDIQQISVDIDELMDWGSKFDEEFKKLRIP